jgi:translocation and assembly module TamB
MRRRTVVLTAALAALVVLPLVAAHRLLHSEAGLQFALAQLSRIPSVRIEATGAGGTLAGPLTVQRLVVEHEAVRIEAAGVRLDARLRSLLGGNVHLERASADSVEVVLKPREAKPPERSYFLPRFLEILAPELRLANVGLTLTNGQRIAVSSIRGALAMDRWRIDLTDLAIDDPAGHLDGALTLRATLPLGLRGSVNGHWRLPDERTYRFAAAVRGNLGRLATTVTLAEPASLLFIGNALTLTGTPRLVGTLRATDFDGSPWLPAGEWPRVNGSIALDATPSAFGLDGTLTADAFGDGPVRVQGNGRRQEQTLDISSLRVWLPRSSLALRTAGTIKFGGPAPEIALTGEWTALRWPLTGEVSVESALGVFSVHGALPYAFELQAHARAPLINGAPAAQFTAAGSVDREQLVLATLDGEALRGRVSGSGRVSWAGDQPWSARIEARNLDVAMVRPDLPGRISAAVSIAGRGFTPAAPWTARLASLSGTVLGRALTGRGEVSHSNGNYDLRRVRVANGASYVEVDGRWGGTVDLRWNADVRSLALLRPDLAGEFVSSGRARGSATRPQVEGEVRAQRLNLGGITVQSLQADVDLDLTDARESRMDVRASAVNLGVAELDTVRFDAHGRTGAHDLALEIASAGDDQQRMPGFRARFGATGDYDTARRAWRGQLEDATLRFPDGDATLLQPAVIEANPVEQRAAPICIKTGEARLCVEGQRRGSPATWRLLYSAQDWPLRRLLRSLLGWQEFDGRLQGAGWLAQEPGQDWAGGMTLLVDDPTLDIPRNQFRTEHVRLGGGRLDVFAEPDALRANLDLRLVEGTQMHGEVVAAREPRLAMTDYPLRGAIRVESAALTSLPVFVPEIDRSNGRLDASITVAGTLGDPRFDGEFHVRDGRFDLYRTNLLLSGVTLDGRFVGDELVFEGSGRTARGSMEFDGRFTWPDDVMTGAMHLRGERLMLADTPDYRILASPNLTLTAGADGYEVNGDVLIPQARITPKDLSTTVGTSPDERVVGAESAVTGPATLERVRSRVRVELGDDVRVDSYGLKAKLGGGVTVITRPGDIVRGDGAINVVEGEYKAFGQYVKIKRGVLSYKMAPLDEPTLDLVGEREIKPEDIVVSINVRGTLEEPFVTLSSEPPLPEAEALSYLLTGRSINTLQSGEAASLNRAAESIAIGGGGLLLGGIGTRIGLDEVSVEQTGEADTAVVLGKYLSPKLFVSYGISIAEAINTIKLRYTLNEHWSLKAEAGLEQSGDIEYRIER